MKKVNNRKGFTLAELLIVVAIIAVLVAIAIPVFSSQLEKAREAADLANIRSAYGELISWYLSADNPTTKQATIPVTQKQNGWQTNGGKDYAFIGTNLTVAGSTAGGISVKSQITGSYTLEIDNAGVVSCKNS